MSFSFFLNGFGSKFKVTFVEGTLQRIDDGEWDR